MQITTDWEIGIYWFKTQVGKKKMVTIANSNNLNLPSIPNIQGGKVCVYLLGV